MKILRIPFVDALEAYVAVLDQVSGGQMGRYLTNNIKKLRSSKAKQAELDYRAWLLSELPVHKSTGYKSYVDDSAWMGNLWLGWTLEFFVEMFALVHEGKDTKTSVDRAYEQTLYNHMSFFERQSFTMAMSQLPARKKMLEMLRGDADAEDVKRDIGTFVSLGRSVVRTMIQLNGEVEQRMTQERNRR